MVGAYRPAGNTRRIHAAGHAVADEIIQGGVNQACRICRTHIALDAIHGGAEFPVMRAPDIAYVVAELETATGVLLVGGAAGNNGKPSDGHYGIWRGSVILRSDAL